MTDAREIYVAAIRVARCSFSNRAIPNAEARAIYQKTPVANRSAGDPKLLPLAIARIVVARFAPARLDLPIAASQTISLSPMGTIATLPPMLPRAALALIFIPLT